MLDVKEKLIGLINAEFNRQGFPIAETTNFIDGLGMDSLDAVELMMAIEEEFGIDIPDTVEFVTVQDAVNYIEKATVSK